MTLDPKPDLFEYADTPYGFHRWAQDMAAWNSRHNIRSEDLVKQWNEQRKNA